MFTRHSSGYWFLVVFFLSSLYSFGHTSKPEEENSKQVWVFGLPEAKKNTLAKDILAYFSGEKKEPLSTISKTSKFSLKLARQEDSFLFFVDSSTLVHQAYEIIEHLQKAIDYIPENKFEEVVSNLDFIVRETSDEAIDKERVHYYLFRLHQKLEKMEQLGYYSDKDRIRGVLEKNRKIMLAFSKSVEKRKIHIWKEK